MPLIKFLETTVQNFFFLKIRERIGSFQDIRRQELRDGRSKRLRCFNKEITEILNAASLPVPAGAGSSLDLCKYKIRVHG